MDSRIVSLLLCAFAILPVGAQVTLDHHWTNTDAQSLIGLLMESHKTIVTGKGDLRWSQWSLKRKPLDVPIGIRASEQKER